MSSSQEKLFVTVPSLSILSFIVGYTVLELGRPYRLQTSRPIDQGALPCIVRFDSRK